MDAKPDQSQTITLYDADRRTQRRCGDCQLCCKLLPMPELDKPANCRCRHQRAAKGCAIYSNRPASCALWNCRWLAEKDCADLPRPDRAHYVLDIMPDYVTLVDNESGAARHVPVIQVWCDPAWPEAHRAASFRTWLDRQRTCALIRYGSSGGFLLAPPSVTGQGWHEQRSDFPPAAEHRLDDVLRVMGSRLVVRTETE